ncbi:MAG: small ribosomal subunit Rsm22 family protein [Ktedonobacteraceae bacterium]
MDLPDSLRFALANELATIPQKSLAGAAAHLSVRYRSNHSPGEGSLARSPIDVAAYAAYRLPATFAAIYATLDEVRKRRPGWQPRTLLDAGAGPGTATWAASELWPELEQITLLEREETMIAFGKQMSRHASSAAVRQAHWQRVDLFGKWESVPCDLVITSYVLGELPPLRREEFLNKLWAQTADTLVIIEPGTPAGFSHIRSARQHLIYAGANIMAPCPHNLACPMGDNDWCHFSQRISRTQVHRQIKRADLSYEDEKFSYVVLSRTIGLPISGRVIRHPQIRSGHIYLELCTPGGLKTSIVTRKDREAFRQVRDLHWGDAVSSS